MLLKGEVLLSYAPLKIISTTLSNSFKISASSTTQSKYCVVYPPYNAKYMITDTPGLACFEEQRICMSLQNVDQCVIKIKNATKYDEGIWKCATGHEADNKIYVKDYIYHVTVRSNNYNMVILAPSITTLTGVSLLAFVLYHYIRYRKLSSSSEQNTTYLRNQTEGISLDYN